MATARAAPGVLLVGFNRRFSPMLRRSLDHVSKSGERRTILYRVAAGQLSDHWAHDLAEGGGRLLGEACHFVDCAAYLAESPIVSVYATGYGADDRPLQARDRVVIALQFANGSVASILYTAEGARELPKERCEVSSGPYTAVVDDYQRLELLGPGAPRGEKLHASDKGHRAEIARYLAAVADGRDLIPLAELE